MVKYYLWEERKKYFVATFGCYQSLSEYDGSLGEGVQVEKTLPFKKVTRLRFNLVANFYYYKYNLKKFIKKLYRSY